MKKVPLIILVGKSGAGKSTICKAMDCEENWFISSNLIIESLKEQGLPVNHDTIHKLATKKYRENPEWQVPYILEAMKNKDFLLLDGPRKVKEVNALINKCPYVLIIEIVADERDRFKRLKERDSIDKNAFQRIIKDENEETSLNKIIKMANLRIDNSGSLLEVGQKAKELKRFLLTLNKVK